MLKLKDICVSFRSEQQKSFFGKTMKQILFNVSFDVQKGTCLGILGESGSGKSTLGRVICGILKPDSGSYTLAVFLELPPPLAKSLTGTKDGLEISHVAMQQEGLEGGDIVQPPTHTHHAA